MNRQLLVHGSWLAVTAVAFVGGWRLAHPPEPGPRSGTAEGVAGVRKGTMSRSRGGSPGPGGESRPAGRRDGGPVSEIDREVPADERVVDLLVRNAIKEGNPLDRRRAFDRILSSLSPENAVMIRNAMVAHGAGGEHWGLFNYAWGAVDPEGALAWLPEVPERYQDSYLGNVLRGWASKRPEDAVAYLEGMENGDRREKMVGMLLDGLADNDIGVATDYLLGLQAAGNGSAGRHIDALAREALRVEGVVGARHWAEALPESSLKAAALDRVANRFVAENPEEAGRWAARYAGQDYAWRVIEEVGDEWAERDPPSAVAWLDDLPDGKGRNEGMRSAFGEWARKDAVAAGEYLLSMPEGETRDVAVSGYSTSLAWRDPEVAMEWAQSISSSGARLQAVTRAGQAWVRRNKTAATQWVQSSGLPEKVQQAILNPSHKKS